MTQHRHSVFVGLGFALAYIATMVVMLVEETGRLQKYADAIVTFICGPAIVIGIGMILVARIASALDQGDDA